MEVLSRRRQNTSKRGNSRALLDRGSERGGHAYFITDFSNAKLSRYFRKKTFDSLAMKVALGCHAY